MTSIATRRILRRALSRAGHFRLHAFSTIIPQSTRTSCMTENAKYSHGSITSYNIATRYFSKDGDAEDKAVNDAASTKEEINAAGEFNLNVKHIHVPDGEEARIIKGLKGSNSSSKEKDVIKDREDYTEEVTVELPDLGEVKGRILKWYKEEGEYIFPDDTICDIETEMFTFGMDVEDKDGGILKEILVKEGEGDVDPGTPICTLLHKPDK